MAFDNGADGYYAFKPGIESQDMIREVLGTDDPGVIYLFKQWWGKYKISLRDLDAQVEEAEIVMKGYLEELGYE